MRRLAGILLAMFAAAPGPAAAEGKVLVELFTSQGCSSCPPADRFMEELAAREDIVALTMPVDIWDYLGWRDTFAKRVFTERQTAYADRLPARSVYTPQMVIAGATDIVGSRREEALRLVEAAAAVPGGATVAITLSGTTALVDVAAVAPPSGQASVYLARVLSSRQIDIGGGENRGRVIVYANVVRELTLLGRMGPGAMRFEVPAREEIGEIYDRLAVIVQDADTGPVLGAAIIPLGD
jgi:hypothetical protein